MTNGNDLFASLHDLEQKMSAKTAEMHKKEEELREMVTKEIQVKKELYDITSNKPKLNADIMRLKREIADFHQKLTMTQNSQRDKLRKGGVKLR